MTQEAIQEQIRQALDHRIAVRVYDENRDISRQDMDVILDAAWLSPSSVGLEGWRFWSWTGTKFKPFGLTSNP